MSLLLPDRFVGLERRAADYRTHLRDNPQAVEVRTFTFDRPEVRSADGKLTLSGRAIVFGQPSVDMGYWREVIQRGAVRKVLAGKPDVRLLVNHSGLPFARTTNGTLTLREEADGVYFDAELPDIPEARSLAALVERGDIDQMSFAFRVADKGATWTENEDGSETRTVTEIAYLPEISIVTFPAYEATSVTTSRSAPDADSQEGPDDHQESEPIAADQRQVDLDATSDPAGADPEDIERRNALALEGLAARRRRHGAHKRA